MDAGLSATNMKVPIENFKSLPLLVLSLFIRSCWSLCTSQKSVSEHTH